MRQSVERLNYVWDKSIAPGMLGIRGEETLVAPDPREWTVLEACDAVVGRFMDFLRARSETYGWYFDPIDLLEVARIRLVFDMVYSGHAWVSWSKLKERGYSAVRLFAYAHQADHLQRQARALGFDVRTVPVPSEGNDSQRTAVSVERLRRGVTSRFAAWRNRMFSECARRKAIPAPSVGRRYLFLDWCPNHVDTMAPIWAALRQNSACQMLYVAGRPEVTVALKRYGIEGFDIRQAPPHLPYPGPAPPQWPQVVDTFLRHWPADWLSPTSELRDYLLRCRDVIAQTKFWALRLREILRRFAPHAVFTSTPASIDARAAQLLARKERVLSVDVQHGIYPATPVRRHQGHADLLCMWGPYHRNSNSRYLPGKKLFSVGSPKHDELLRRYHHVKQQDAPLIVYFGSRAGGTCQSQEGYKAHLRAIHKTAEEAPQWQFVVKAHPADSPDAVARSLADLRQLPNLRVTQSDDSYRLLQASTAAVVFSSTLAYEAALFRRRVVLLNPQSVETALPLPYEACEFQVSTAEELMKALLTIVNERDEPYPDGFRSRYWAADGHSVERILTLVEHHLRDLLVTRSSKQ